MVQPVFAAWREEACLSTTMVWRRLTRVALRLLWLAFGSRTGVAALALLPSLAFGGGGRASLQPDRCSR